MGNSNKSSLRKSQSVPDTQRLAPDAPVFDKQKSVSQLRLNQTHEKPGKPGKAGKKHKQQQQIEEVPQLAPSDAAFVPEFPLRGELEDLDFVDLGVIARGAYGNVIKVQREDQKQFYAVKVLDKFQILEEGAIRQCKDEATIQSMAGEHPFVVKAHEYWQSSRSLFIVLDYIPHGDMFTLWTFHGAFPEKLVQVYIAEMAMVIDYLHNASVIYRDVKMENILFNAKGHIQLTDFGLAKWLQGGDQTRTVCGTLQYMAPEVLSVYPYGHSVDWWSLGILMYAMLAGRYPVDGADTHTKMAQKVFECDFFLPSDISDSAQDVINNLLTKSPHKRLCDVNSLQDLDFFQDIFFNDLIEQKLNPLDVVPEDFFPMTGHSWAPQLLTPGEQSAFDEFDGNNDNFSDQHGNLHPAQYRHPAPHHHPDPVVRLQPSQPHQQQHQYGRHHASPSEQPPHQQPPGEKQHKYGGHRSSPTEQPLHQQPPDEKQHKYGGHRSSPGEQPPHQQLPGEKQHSHWHPQHLREHKKPFPEFPGSVPASGHDAAQKDVNISNDPTTSDRRREFISNLSSKKDVNKGYRQGDLQQSRHDSLENLLQQNNAVAGFQNNSKRINGSIARSNSGSDWKSSGIDCYGSSDAGRISNNLGPTSSSTTLNQVTTPAKNENRISTGAEFKTVEAPPTVTLKTMVPAGSVHPKNNESHMSYSSQAHLGNSVLPGSAPQNFGMGAQSFGFKASSLKSDYSVQGQNSRIHVHSDGMEMSGDQRVVDWGYKTFEVAPTITLPSPQINFNQSPNMPQNNNLQPNKPQNNNLQPNIPLNNLKRPPQAAGNFSFPPSAPVSSSFTGTNYGRLEQATVTSNNAQVNIAAQRKAPPARPIPAQRPVVATKPAVPVKPIPAPRRSLRRKSEGHAGRTPEIQDRLAHQQDANSSVVGVNYPYAFSTGHGQHVTSQPQSRNVINDSSFNPHDWRNTPQPQHQAIVDVPSLAPQSWSALPQSQNPTDPSLNPQDWRNTPQPQNQTVISDPSFNAQDWRNTTQPLVDETRPRSGSTNSSRRETASRSLSVESENFEWNLPMGSRPSFV